MENPFKKILHNEELPVVLKKKVLNDIDMVKLTIDMADLFVVKYPSIIGDLLVGGKAASNEIKEEN